MELTAKGFVKQRLIEPVGCRELSLVAQPNTIYSRRGTTGTLATARTFIANSLLRSRPNPTSALTLS
jgi:hypothetical protein